MLRLTGTVREEATGDRLDRSQTNRQNLDLPVPVSGLRIRLPQSADRRQAAEKAPSRFLQRIPPPVIVDEVQYAPGPFAHLKVAVDFSPQESHQRHISSFVLPW